MDIPYRSLTIYLSQNEPSRKRFQERSTFDQFPEKNFAGGFGGETTGRSFLNNKPKKGIKKCYSQLP